MSVLVSLLSLLIPFSVQQQSAVFQPPGNVEMKTNLV